MGSGGVGQVTGKSPTYAQLVGAQDPTGNLQAVQQDASGNLKVSGTFSATNAANGTTGATAPVQATEVGFVDGTGKLQAFSGTSAASGPNVAVSSSALPSNAAQETGGHLASIDTKTPALGQALSAASTPVVLPAAQITTLTPPTTVGLNAGSNTIGSVKVTDGTNTGAVKAASTAPVAADPSLVVSISPNTADPGLGSATGGTAATKSYATGGIFNTTLPTLTTGQQSAFQLDSSGRQILGTSVAVIGAVTQSGTWTVQPGNTANTTAWLVTQDKAATGTITSVAGTTSSTQLLASNAARKHATFYNESTAILYLAFAGSASTTAYTVQIPASGYYELPAGRIYSGAIFGIWAAANGNVRITELS